MLNQVCFKKFVIEPQVKAVEQDFDVVLDEFAAEIHNKNLKLSTKTGTEFTVLSKSGKDITVRTSTTKELYISKAAIKGSQSQVKIF